MEDDAQKDWALMTVKLGSNDRTVADAAEALGVPVDAIRGQYGLVPVDRERDLFAVQVDAAHLAPAQRSGTYRGPFSDPRISPFTVRDE